MKKSLIALAVAGTMVAPAAMADTSNVNVYGEANVSIDMVKSGETALTGGSVSANQVTSNESHIGFKGSEDLGGGVSAIFQIETEINYDSGPTDNEDDGEDTVDGIGDRNTFAGLKSDAAGSLTLGRRDTPYKMATRGLDLFADGIADNRSLMVDGGRPNDSINYMSPTMGGFSVAAAYALGAEQASASTDTKGKAISVAAMYDMAPFYATIAHQKITYGTASSTNNQFTGTDGDSDKTFAVGGSYKTDMFAVNAVIETAKMISGGGTTTDEVRNIYVGGQFNITGNDAIKLAVTQRSDSETNGVDNIDTGARQMSVGYDHSLSKRTTVYALYTRLSNKRLGTETLTGTSSSGGPAGSGADADPSAFSFGMKHSF